MTDYIEVTDIIREMKKTRHELRKAIEDLRRYAEQKSKAEQAYRTALRQEILALRAEGMPATLVSDVARGKEDIARLQLERDIYTEYHKTALELVRSRRVEISLLQSIGRYHDDY